MLALLKGAAAVSLLIPLASASPWVPSIPPTMGNNHPLVEKVLCDTARGTAFRVGKDYWLSVKHVTDKGNCKVNGEPVKELWNSPTQDFSIFRLEARTGKSFKIDCGGFRDGAIYTATGHARGLDDQTHVTLTATSRSISGFAVLKGVFTVIPGQSGGPVIDRETGKVVGTINVFQPVEGLSGSLPLRDTPVCA